MEEDKKYGEKTLGMMIQRALAQAGLLRKSGTSKSTDYIKALVADQVKKEASIQRQKLAVIGILALAGTLALIYYRHEVESAPPIGNPVPGGAPRPAESIAKDNREAVFLIAGRPRGSSGAKAAITGFCSAFAISSNLLATNAHCAKTATADFTGTIAIMNGAPEKQFSIVRAVSHPAHIRDRISPDVGVMQVKGKLNRTVQIAPASALTALGPGTTVFLYGFPGPLTKVDAPEATFVKGALGRVTGFDQKRGRPDENTLLQHSAFSSSGTSGSPIFNAAGQVIGINSGGYVKDGQPLGGYNFGMRIDLLNPPLARMGDR